MKFTEYLAKVTEEDSGRPSTMRLIVLYGCIINLTVPAALWIAAACGADKAGALCAAASTACGAVITALLAMKLGQNAQEKDKSP